jgi:hypothetical protein
MRATIETHLDFLFCDIHGFPARAARAARKARLRGPAARSALTGIYLLATHANPYSLKYAEHVVARMSVRRRLFARFEDEVPDDYAIVLEELARTHF